MTKEDIKTHIEDAEGRALATTGPHGVNCVPVSVVKVLDDTIHLFDFFMGKTVENLKTEPEVALSCWKGLCGVQVKATASYVTEGEVFEAAKIEMKSCHPDRVLSGVIVLEPSAFYDISAGAEAGKEIIGE